MSNLHLYAVRVEPHLTDYAGVVWHGSYMRWLEEARIDALRQAGLEYADLVKSGCDLPVIKMELNYSRALRMGDQALVKSRIVQRDRVRILWEQNIYYHSQNDERNNPIALESKITLVPVDIKKQRILRQIPANLEQTLSNLMVEPDQV